MTNFYSNSDRGYSLLMIVENVGTPNIANNTSDVRARLYLRNTTTTFAGYNVSGSMTIDGTSYSYSASPSMLSNNSSILLLDKTKSGIGHNSDGKKTITVSASIRGSGGYSPGTLTIGNNQFTLPVIQRASTVTCTSELDIGSTMTIGITAQSTSFTHEIRYNWNGKLGTIASGTTSTSLTWTVPMDFCNDIPNGTRFVGTIYCDTYLGSTLIGTKQSIFYGNVPASVKPTLSSITLTDTNNKASTLVGASNFVQIMSNASVTFNGASGAYGSTISTYKAEIVGKNQSTFSNGGTLGIMSWNGTATVQATVTDSRGRTSAPVTLPITVLPYSGITFDFKAERGSANANQIVVTVTASISPLLVGGVQKNKMTFSFKSAPFGTQTFTIDTSSASTTYTSKYELLSQSFILSGTFADNKSFDIYGTMSDGFGITDSKKVTVIASFTAFALQDGGTIETSGIGIGKKWEHGSVDAAGDIYTLGKIFIKNKELLDVFYPVGTIYESTKSDNPSTFMGGTWSRFGNGRVLVGVDETDTTFNVPLQIGGEKAHILTEAEMPSHTHKGAGNNNILIDGSGYTGATITTTGGGYQKVPNTASAGGGQAHNNLQPFVTVYRWQRTA